MASIPVRKAQRVNAVDPVPVDRVDRVGGVGPRQAAVGRLAFVAATLPARAAALGGHRSPDFPSGKCAGSAADE